MKLKDKVLVVEDEQNISNFISTVLTANDFDVLVAQTGAEAVSMITSHCPDLIILDLGLPDMDGINILKEVRSWSSLPIIVVSARTHEHDKVMALDLGADDYLTKPFNILEVKARMKAIMRRVAKKDGMSASGKVVVKGDLKIDCESRRVFSGDRELNLTAKEFDLLELLAMNQDKVYSRENLLNICG